MPPDPSPIRLVLADRAGGPARPPESPARRRPSPWPSRPNATLGKTILTNTRGPHPLQPQRRDQGQVHLHRRLRLDLAPLLVPAGVKPTGPVKLGTIEAARRERPR